MIDVQIRTTFVSEVAKVGFADAAAGVGALTGGTLAAGRYQLSVSGAVDDHGDPTTLRFAGSLRRRSGLGRPIDVEVVLLPWSATLTEVGISPVSNLGSMESMRASRFVRAAREILTELIGQLSASRPTTESETRTDVLRSAA